MNKILRAEIWEVQVILYLILAQMVETDWIMWVIRIWAFISLIGTFLLLIKAKAEEKDTLTKEE